MDAIHGFVRHRFTIRFCQIAIGAIFLYAALPKIGDVEAFARQVHNYRLLPIALENLLAMTLPWIELTAGLALVVGIRARAGATLSVGLMVVFLVAIGQAVYRGLDIDCGCFGTSDGSQVGIRRLAEDVLFLALAAVGSLRAR
jgi:uncharacterized membrane protein YphA (DoxX/SURF4 family)